MSNKKGLSDRILNMKFMKKENSSLTESNETEEDNWKIIPYLDEKIEESIDENISKYKKPKNLVKKIYENARKMSNIRKKIKEDEIKKIEEANSKEEIKNKNLKRLKKI